MSQKRRALLSAGLAAAVLTAMSTTSLTAYAANANTESYPTRPVKIVVGYGPGASTDMTARLAAEILSKELNGNFIVENRPGAGGNIGAVVVKNSAPDGYTLQLAIAAHVTNRGLHKNLPYDPIKDFAPITLIARIPFILVANPSFPGDTLQDVIRMAKEAPGALDYATAGIGSSQHLSGEQFVEVTGAKWNHIPYNGGSPALVAVAAGEVPLAFLTTQLVAPMVKEGTLKAIAIASEQRSPLLPDVPTFAEAGLPDYTADTWYGLLAPAGTPEAIINKIHAALSKGLEDESVRQRLTAQDAFIINMAPEEFARKMKEDDEKWARIFETIDVEPR